MGAGHPAQADVRREVRRALRDAVASPGEDRPLVLAAVSGGADSLALAAGLAAEASALGVRCGAIVVDHRLQEGSGEAAARAASQCRGLGLEPVEIARVDVIASGSGVEAAARDARYDALEQAAARLGSPFVLIGHTRDDQAEQVLLGLARGSGARSLAGMPAVRGRFVRPLLAVSRETTEAACAAWGLTPFVDPMNSDPAYTRVRARRALDDLEADLGPGIRESLARTADQLRADADELDRQAEAAVHGLSGLASPGHVAVDVSRLAPLPDAVRTRVWRRLLLLAGAPAGQLARTHVLACDRLVGPDYRGQGPIDVPGVVVDRRGPRVFIDARPRV